MLHKGKERKGKEGYLYSAIYTTYSLNALRHRSHSFTCKIHYACLSFVSVHQMAPSLTEVAPNCSLLLIFVYNKLKVTQSVACFVDDQLVKYSKSVVKTTTIS